VLSKQVRWGKLCFGYLMLLVVERLRLIVPGKIRSPNPLPKETLFIGFYYTRRRIKARFTDLLHSSTVA